MVGDHLSNEAIDRILIGRPAFVYFGEPWFLAAEIEMVESAGEAQRHRVFQRFSRPVRDLLSAGSGAADQRQLADDDRSSNGRIVAQTMFRLTAHSLGDIFNVQNVHNSLPFHLRTRKAAAIMAKPLIFAIPKGRILDDALPLLEQAGIVPEDAFFDKSNRSLQFATNQDHISIIRVRAFDVATFVAHGAAQIGIVGSDVIEEFGYSELYAPVDLGIGRCRLSLAQPKDDAEQVGNISHLRVATKYPNLTSRYFESKGIQAECVKLNGAMELAPSLGLSRHIVDLVESGSTLKANNLVETDRILDISGRLVVNRAAYKMRSAELTPLVQKFRELVGQV
jgi:ATP phosphoribosyltransferase